MSLRALIELNAKDLFYMEKTNNHYLHVKEQYENFSHKALVARRHLNSVKILETMIKNSRDAYSLEVKDSIAVSLSKCLEVVLLDKEYDVALEIYTFYDKQHLRAWLIDENGVELPPNIVEGDMLNQVMSFCASVILTKMQGYSYFFYDEAFASANPRSVIMIRKLIKLFIEEGFTFVFVSQNPLLFTEFDRNLIELKQTAGHVSAVTQTFIFASQDSSIDEQVLDMHDKLLKGGKL